MSQDPAAQTPEDAEPTDGVEIWEEGTDLFYQLTVQMPSSVWYLLLRIDESDVVTCCTQRRRRR